MEFLEDIEKYGQENDLIRSHSGPITCTAGFRIQHHAMAIYRKFDIIIGRREELKLNEIDLEKKAEFGRKNIASLITSDRLLEGTKKIDAHPEVYC